MILLLQVLLGAAVTAWYLLGGLPPLVAIPLAAWGAAFMGLWRRPRQRRDQRPPFRNPPPPRSYPPHEIIGPSGTAYECNCNGERGCKPPFRLPPRKPERDHLADLELAERFERESG